MLKNFLNAWDSWLNSRGTRVSFLAILLLCFLVIGVGIWSCDNLMDTISDLNATIAKQEEIIEFQSDVITAQDALINVQTGAMESYDRDIAAKDADIDGLSKMLESSMAQNTDLQADIDSVNRQFDLLQEAVPINVILNVGDPQHHDADTFEWTCFAHPDPDADFDTNRRTVVAGITSVQVSSSIINISHIVFRGETYKPDVNGIVVLPLSDKEVGQLYFSGELEVYINSPDGSPLYRTFLRITVEPGAV